MKEKLNFGVTNLMSSYAQTIGDGSLYSIASCTHCEIMYKKATLPEQKMSISFYKL